MGLAKNGRGSYIVMVKDKLSSNGKKVAARNKAQVREENKQAKVLEAVLNEVTAQPTTEHVEEDLSVACPYCGEEFEVHVTTEEDGQTMYEDCEVCCRPISLHVHTEEGELQIEAYRS